MWRYNGYFWPNSSHTTDSSTANVVDVVASITHQMVVYGNCMASFHMFPAIDIKTLITPLHHGYPTNCSVNYGRMYLSFAVFKKRKNRNEQAYSPKVKCPNNHLTAMCVHFNTLLMPETRWNNAKTHGKSNGSGGESAHVNIWRRSFSFFSVSNSKHAHRFRWFCLLSTQFTTQLNEKSFICR